jgi:hypothetical protein
MPNGSVPNPRVSANRVVAGAAAVSLAGLLAALTALAQTSPQPANAVQAPTPQNIGQLRQSAPAENGKGYWTSSPRYQ